jgi:hypothetical protein
VDRDGREHSWLRLRSNGITLAGFRHGHAASLDGLPSDHAAQFRIGSGADAVSVRGRGAWDAGRTPGFEDIAASGPHRALAPAGRDAPVREPTDAALDPPASSMRRAASA